MAKIKRPELLVAEDATTILFAAEADLKGCETKTIEAVLDFNLFHEPIGVEVINLGFHLGPKTVSLGPWAPGGLEFSYHGDVDAFYIAFGEERHSAYQKAVFADAFLDPNGRLVAFRIAKSELLR